MTGQVVRVGCANWPRRRMQNALRLDPIRSKGSAEDSLHHDWIEEAQIKAPCVGAPLDMKTRREHQPQQYPALEQSRCLMRVVPPHPRRTHERADKRRRSLKDQQLQMDGGDGGIRTLDTALDRITV